MTIHRWSAFDGYALFNALDAQRQERGLSWPKVADALWDQSRVLNERRGDHPISPSTLRSLHQRGSTTCQHALFMLRWLQRAPEDFLMDPTTGKSAPLPVTDDAHRLRWNLRRTYASLDAQRRDESLTWAALASELDCTTSQLTGLRTARFATGIDTAMRIVQWLGTSASSFVDVTSW